MPNNMVTDVITYLLEFWCQTKRDIKRGSRYYCAPTCLPAYLYVFRYERERGIGAHSTKVGFLFTLLRECDEVYVSVS